MDPYQLWGFEPDKSQLNFLSLRCLLGHHPVFIYLLDSTRLKLELLLILAARLVGVPHLEQVDSLVHQQLSGVIHGLVWQESSAAQDPGVLHVEDAEDIIAGVHDRQAGVICTQHPVRTVGSNWEDTQR